MNKEMFFKSAKKMINSKIAKEYKPDWMNYVALKNDGNMYVADNHRCYSLVVNRFGVSNEIVMDADGKIVEGVSYPDELKNKFAQKDYLMYIRFHVDKKMLTVIKQMIQIASMNPEAKKHSKRSTLFKVEKKKYEKNLIISTHDSYFEASYEAPCTNELSEFTFYTNAYYFYELIEMAENSWLDLDFHGSRKPIEFTFEHDVMSVWICPFVIG